MAKPLNSNYLLEVILNILKMEFKNQDLLPITNPLNSFFIQKKYQNVDQKFKQLIYLVENLPRTKKILSNKNYWKGVCRSRFFRFPDDLEIFKKSLVHSNNNSEGYIQIRSAARWGHSDLGVNQRRVSFLINELNKIIN